MAQATPTTSPPVAPSSSSATPVAAAPTSSVPTPTASAPAPTSAAAKPTAARKSSSGKKPPVSDDLVSAEALAEVSGYACWSETGDQIKFSDIITPGDGKVLFIAIRHLFVCASGLS